MINHSLVLALYRCLAYCSHLNNVFRISSYLGSSGHTRGGERNCNSLATGATTSGTHEARARRDIGYHDDGGDDDFFGMTMLGGMSCKGGKRLAAVLREF